MVNPIQNELGKREEKTIAAHRIASKEKKEKKWPTISRAFTRHDTNVLLTRSNVISGEKVKRH